MDTEKRKKGRSLLVLPEDYCVVDIETTGLSPKENEIIEISAVKYRGLKKTETFSTLIKPVGRISPFITSLTGISNDMVSDAPDISRAILDFYDFARGELIMGYNVNFDIDFLYDNLLRCHGIVFDNDFVDVVRFARRALPDMPRRSQTLVAEHYGISAEGAHRAEVDCEICNAVYQRMMKEQSVIECTKGKSNAKK
jgi:DNA polymerase III epsilon subunit family exonuclease